MKMTMGWTETQTWATVCVHLNKENSQRTDDTNWQQGRETTKNEGSSMHDGSCIGIKYAHRFPKCFKLLHTLWGFSLYTSCHQFNCCRCTKFIQILTCTRIPWNCSHCEKGLLKCCLYTPRRLQQTAVSCKRSNCNKIENIKKNRECRSSVVLSKDGKQRVSPFYHVALHVSSFVDFHLNFLWAPPGIAPLPPTGGRTRWLVPVLILPEWHWLELSFSRFVV